MSHYTKRIANVDSFFDDLRFPANSLNPAGGGTFPAAQDTALAGFLFDADRAEYVEGIAQLPHSWREGTDLSPHIHWTKTNNGSGNVFWQLEYKWAPVNEVIDASWTTSSSTTTVAGTPDTNTQNKHLITSFGNIDATGKEISDMLLFRLSRQGANGSDTYNNDARLLEFDMHYEIDGWGSDQEFTKNSYNP